MPRTRLRMVASLATLFLLLWLAWFAGGDIVYEDEAGKAVVKYLHDNGGRWPKSWKDLEPYSYGSTKALERHVTIDFDVDVDQLRHLAVGAKSRSGFNLIRGKRLDANRGDFKVWYYFANP